MRTPKPPLVKGSWRRAPEGLARRSGKAPLSGELSAKQTERLLQICDDLSVSASPSHLPWEGRPWGTHSNGFPYEGKLSPEATDEVGGVV